MVNATKLSLDWCCQIVSKISSLAKIDGIYLRNDSHFGAVHANWTSTRELATPVKARST